jgi:hypothetical protein
MFDKNTASSKAFSDGFHMLTSQLQNILDARNQTILDLYRDLAIE